MAEETNRLSAYATYVTAAVQHDVGIDLRIFPLSVTLKADCPPVYVRTFPQEIYASFKVVLYVAGQTHDFPVIERERVINSMKRDNADRMMIFRIFVALKAF